jgi:uncharacterized phage protein (TIGR02218 family)
MKDFSPLSITSAAVGFPARICVITRTDGTIFRIAESDTALSVSGDAYQVVPGLQISAVKHTINGEMPSCQINAVHENGGTITTEDLDIGLFDGADVQIYIVDRMDLTSKGLLFSGSIANVSYDVENMVTIDVKGPAVSARVLMTQRRSPMCRTDLFSVLCGLNPASFDVATSVDTIVNAFNFTVTGALAQADGYFNQGVVVTADGTSFEIANWSQSTQTITAYLPCSRIITEGGGLTLYPGCDKTMGVNGCPKFSNQLNFQGEPHFLGAAAAAQQA